MLVGPRAGAPPPDGDAGTQACGRQNRSSRGSPASALWLLPLLGLYVVVCAVWQPRPGPVHDEAPLLGYAHKLLEGGYVQDDAYVRPMRFLWHPPGLPLVLSPLVALEIPLAAIRCSAALFLLGAVLAFHRLLRTRLARRPALVWSYAFGLYGPALAMLPELHKDLLAVLLVALAMLGLTRGLAEGRAAWLLGAGVSLGALALTRAEYGWVLLGMTAIAAVRWALPGEGAAAARRLVACGLVALAVSSPWLAYTHSVTGKLFYWGNSAGLSLFWMSPTARGETGEWHPRRHVMWDPALRGERRLFRHLSTLPPLEADAELRRRALANVRADPWRYGRNLAANFSRLFFLVPMRYGYPAWIVAGATVFNGLLLAAVAWAAVRLRRRPRSLPPEAAAFALLAALGVLVHLPAPASPRLLLSVVPLLLWFVAHAHASLSAQPRSGTRAGWPDTPPPALAVVVEGSQGRVPAQ